MSYSQSDRDVVAQVQLYKAVLLRKAALIQEVNTLKISKNYRQSNQDFKALKEFLSITKVLFKRLSEVRINIRRIQKLPKKKQDLNLVSNILLTCLESQEKLEVPRGIFSLNFQAETFLEELKEKYESLSSEYELKISQLKQFEPLFSHASEQLLTSENLEQEIFECYNKFEILCGGRENFTRFKTQKKIKSKSSFDAIKVFQKLSENGLVLRSKLLLKQELGFSLKTAERELENLEKRIREKENFQYLEYGKNDLVKVQQKYEVELTDSRRKIQKLELRLRELAEEKETILDFLAGNKIEKDEENSGDDTLSLNHWIAGFDSMQKEKDLLMQENQKLKDRISRLSKSGF